MMDNFEQPLDNLIADLQEFADTFSDRESVMDQWDCWRKMIASGHKGSLPRDGFEAMIDGLDVVLAQAVDALTQPRSRASAAEKVTAVTEEWLRDTTMNVMLASEVKEGVLLLKSAIGQVERTPAPTAAMVDAITHAILQCPHSIEQGQITFRFDPVKNGRNALSQLTDRVKASLENFHFEDQEKHVHSEQASTANTQTGYPVTNGLVDEAINAYFGEDKTFGIGELEQQRRMFRVVLEKAWKSAEWVPSAQAQQSRG